MSEKTTQGPALTGKQSTPRIARVGVQILFLDAQGTTIMSGPALLSPLAPEAAEVAQDLLEHNFARESHEVAGGRDLVQQMSQGIAQMAVQAAGAAVEQLRTGERNLLTRRDAETTAREKMAVEVPEAETVH